MPHRLHLGGSRGLGANGMVEVECVAHFPVLVLGLWRVLPGTLHNIERLPLSLKVVEKFRVGEEQSEQVVDGDIEVPTEYFPGVLALSPRLVCEKISGRDDAGVGICFLQGDWSVMRSDEKSSTETHWSSPFSPVTEVRLVSQGAVSVLLYLPRFQLLGLLRNVAVEPGGPPQSRHINTIKTAVAGRVVALVSVVLTSIPDSSQED